MKACNARASLSLTGFAACELWEGLWARLEKLKAAAVATFVVRSKVANTAMTTHLPKQAPDQTFGRLFPGHS